MKPIRLLLIGAMVVLGLAATGLPAQAELAENSGVVIFRGTADVCGDDVNTDTKDSNDTCNQPNDKGEQGLYGPSTQFKNWTKRVGNYRFESGDLVDALAPLNAILPECVAVGVNGIGQPDDLNPDLGLNKINVKSCSIDVEGKLAPVAGVGAACGMSHGHSGWGELVMHKTVTDRVYQLENVGWVLSLVGTLPVTGTYQLKEDGEGESTFEILGEPVELGKDEKKGDPGSQGVKTRTVNGVTKTRKITKNTASSGPFVSVVQAQGGQNCFKVPPGAPTSGAATFNVIGVVKVF